MPPVPTGTPPDPGGADSVERASRRQQQVAQAYQAYRQSIPDGVSPDELRDSAGLFGVSDHALTLQPALDAVAADADAANQRLADLTKGTEVPNDQTGQAQMIWARAKDRLDKAKTVAQKAAIAQDLIAGADGLTLATYQAELPFYAKTEGIPSDWMPAAFAARIEGGADAVANANKLAKQHAILLRNHQALTRAMSQNTDVPRLLDPATVSDQPYSNPTGA